MSTLRAVLAGCGAMGNGWCRILGPRQDIDIVGLVDVNPEAAVDFAERNGLDVPRFETLDAALATTEVDVVIDTSVPETRRDIAGTAMQAGCHVLSEKPFATSVAEAGELLAIAERTGKTHAIMQNRRYLAGTRGVRQLIADGVIGDVGMICSDFFLGAHFGGFRADMANVLLLDMAIHTFDQARFMTGLDASTAFCDEFNLPGSWYRGNASALVVFEMTGGARYCYRGSWSAEGAPTPWEAEWRIVGSRGTAIWNGVHAPYAEIPPRRRLPAILQARRKRCKLARTRRPRRMFGRNGHRVSQRPAADDEFGGQRQESRHGVGRDRERQIRRRGPGTALAHGPEAAAT